MALDPQTFDPTSVMKDGNRGLLKAGVSRALITGIDLEDELEVVVIEPASGPQVRKWTGNTFNTTGNRKRTHVKLTLTTYKESEQPDPIRTLDSAVSVTVDSVSIEPDPSVPIGPPPPYLDGNYTVKCDGNQGNDYAWLAPDGSGGVELTDSSDDGPDWSFIAVPSTLGSCYTIQAGDGSYLYWENDTSSTNVSLHAGPIITGMMWQINSDCLLAISEDSSVEPNSPYLNGNTSSGAVNMTPDPDSHHGTDWTLTARVRVITA